MESWYRDHEVDNTMEVPLFITLFEAEMANLRTKILRASTVRGNQESLL